MNTRPMVYVENDTTRSYPRTLQQAFPVSEGYRNSVWHMGGRKTSALARMADGFGWVLGVGLLLWLAWACLKVPG